MPHYLKPKELLEEILKSKEQGKLTPTAVTMLVKLATESNKKLKYRDEKDKEDCIAFAIEDLLRYWDRFDITKSNNAFAFYTQIAKHGFAKGWKKIHKYGTHVPISEDGGLYNI
jgi:DNA-directed RNA polymerase specialized sigma subunit